MVILDGKPVDENEVTPERHRFIGTFRHPIPYEAVKLTGLAYPGMYPHQVRGEWLEGKFDVPQYVTITK